MVEPNGLQVERVGSREHGYVYAYFILVFRVSQHNYWLEAIKRAPLSVLRSSKWSL